MPELQRRKKPMGRKPKLTRDLMASFVRLLGSNHTVKLACQKLAVGESTFYKWLELGAETDSGLYREFLELTTGARSKTEMGLVSKIATASRKDWRAAAWLLERMAPKSWGNRGEFTATATATTTTAAAAPVKTGDEMLSGGFSVAITVKGAPPSEEEAAALDEPAAE